MNNTTKTMDNKIMANNKYVGHFVDEGGHAPTSIGFVDNKLTLTSDGFLELTEDLEAIIEKFTGVDEYIMGGDRGAEIREDLMDWIHELVNEESEDE